MRRREFIALVGASAAWPFAAMAQESGRTYRVGGVSVSSRNAPYVVATFNELRRLGFIEDQNLTVEWRTYGPRVDLIPELIAEVVKAHVDVVYVGGNFAIRAAQQVTTTVPILGLTDDMVGEGW
jgi:putative ABC transport system substrate-binding protein